MSGDVDVFRRLFERFGPGQGARIKTIGKERVEDAIARQYAAGFDVLIPDKSGGTHPLRVIPMR